MDVQTDNQALTDEELLYPETYLLHKHIRPRWEGAPREHLVDYLKEIMRQIYLVENWEVGSYGIEYEVNPGEFKVFAADVAVYKDIKLTDEERHNMYYYRINPPERPCPPLFFEVASKSVWQENIGSGENDRPAFFGRMGAKEYFCYDPYIPVYWDLPEGVRLIGWRYDENGKPQQLQPEPDGRLWSETLERWLVPDGRKIRFYDTKGRRQLTYLETLDAYDAAIEAKTRAIEIETKAFRARLKTMTRKRDILRAKLMKCIELRQKQHDFIYGLDENDS